MKKLIFIGTLSILLLSCNKHKIEEKAALEIQVEYVIDGEIVEQDQLLYINEAGNKYSVTRFEYFLSGLQLKGVSDAFAFDSVLYMNIDHNAPILIGNIPVGDYEYLLFNIGVDPANNLTGALSNTPAYEGMAWPLPMGGGYHHMKLEGKYMQADSLLGYAFHIGLNEYLVPVTLHYDISLSGKKYFLKLQMDINEWFKNPYTYDLTAEDSYTMGDPAAMARVRDNGKNVFTIKSIE